MRNAWSDRIEGLKDAKAIFEKNWRRWTMLYYALVFLVVALIAAMFGFGGIAASAAGIAKVLFVVFLVLFVASAIFGFLRRHPNP